MSHGHLDRLPAQVGDFDFLRGGFDVVSRRLTAPLTGSDSWEETSATTIARTFFNGAVSIDEMQFADAGFYGMSVRLFDVVQDDWKVYWINSRQGVLQPPVVGTWSGGTCDLVGPDTYRGGPVPILASYRWSDLRPGSAHWEQAFSADGGQTWEVSWTMQFTGRSDEPDHTVLPKLSSDFDFLTGEWSVLHWGRAHPFDGPDEWREFSSTCRSRTYFNGAISVDEFDFATEGHRGLALRVYQPASRSWSIYWVNSNDGLLQRPVEGRFDGKVGEFRGRDFLDGEPIHVRFLWRWSNAGAHWEQAFSRDTEQRWITNWTMDFTRLGHAAGPC